MINTTCLRTLWASTHVPLCNLSACVIIQINEDTSESRYEAFSNHLTSRFVILNSDVCNNVNCYACTNSN